MRKIFLVAMSFCVSVFSQISGNRTVLDSYYSDYLVFEDSQQVVSSKINYPGLFNDSISTIDIGFVANPYYYSFNFDTTYIANGGANLQLSDLNGWGEKRGRFGNVGGWIGHLYFVNSASNNSTKNEKRYYTGSSAFWFAPYYKSAFKGVSLTFGGNYDKNSYYNSTEISSGNTSSSNNWRNYQGIDVGLNALFQCNERFQVAVNLIADQSINVSDNRSTNVNTYTDYDYYSSYNYNYIYRRDYNYSDTSKFQNCGLGVTILDNKKRRFSTNVNASRNNRISTQNSYSFNNRNDYNYYNNNYNSSSTYDTGNGDVTASLAYSDTKVFKYLKHRACFGISAFASFDFPVNSETYLSFKQLIKGVHSNQYLMHCFIDVPVTIDLNVFNTPLYIVAKITPQISSNISKNYYSQNTTSNNISASVYESAIGIKGKIGNQLECALIPSFKSNIFVAGMELKYNFGSKNEKTKSL